MCTFYHCVNVQEERSPTCTVWWSPDTSSSLKSRPKAWQLHPDWSSSPQSMLVQHCTFIIKLDNSYLRCKSILNCDCCCRATIPSRKPVQLWASGRRTWSFWAQIRGLLYTEPTCTQSGTISNTWMTYYVFFSYRGRVIPADLEAKVIEAKQKVNVSHNDSDSVPSNLFICFYQRLHTMRNAALSRGVYL